MWIETMLQKPTIHLDGKVVATWSDWYILRDCEPADREAINDALACAGEQAERQGEKPLNPRTWFVFWRDNDPQLQRRIADGLTESDAVCLLWSMAQRETT